MTNLGAPTALDAGRAGRIRLRPRRGLHYTLVRGPLSVVRGPSFVDADCKVTSGDDGSIEEGGRGDQAVIGPTTDDGQMTTDNELESLDHPVDNAPVRTLAHRNLTIEGYSRAAVQTYWRVPELKLGFDLGAQPWSFMAT